MAGTRRRSRRQLKQKRMYKQLRKPGPSCEPLTVSSWGGAHGNGANGFRQQTEQKRSKLCEGARFFLVSGSQPSGPTQSSTFNPGGPLPPQEGDLAARNTEEKLVWVMHCRGGKGQTMDYRCRYFLVDFCGAWTQSIRDHFQVCVSGDRETSSKR